VFRRIGHAVSRIADVFAGAASIGSLVAALAAVSPELQAATQWAREADRAVESTQANARSLRRATEGARQTGSQCQLEVAPVRPARIGPTPRLDGAGVCESVGGAADAPMVVKPLWEFRLVRSLCW
jgi:hypothetical protein